MLFLSRMFAGIGQMRKNLIDLVQTENATLSTGNGRISQNAATAIETRLVLVDFDVKTEPLEETEMRVKKNLTRRIERNRFWDE